MSCPPTKRRRYQNDKHEEEKVDVFAASSSAHIFVSSSHSSTKKSVPRPCSHEVTLNHDEGLRRSLHTTPTTPDSDREAHSAYAARLVTWTCNTTGRTVTTDRFDAIHLLTEAPRSYISDSTAVAVIKEDNEEEDSVGYSDLDSDHEDLFYLSSAEAASFLLKKARSRLQSQHESRIATLAARTPTPPPPPPPPPASAGMEEQPKLSRDQFNLMAKTAKVLSESTNAAVLELKILANHGSDARFAFLRKGKEAEELARIWEALKMRKGKMGYEEALAFLEPKAEDAVPPAGGLGLVAYDDSEDENVVEAAHLEDASASLDQEQDEEQEKKRKQAQRLARAKEWLQTRASKAPS